MKKSRYTIDIPTDDGILLFNTLNTGLVHLDESERASYFSLIENKYEPNAEDTSLITQLSDMGYLVKDDADEYTIWWKGEKSNTWSPCPMSLWKAAGLPIG